MGSSNYHRYSQQNLYARLAYDLIVLGIEAYYLSSAIQGLSSSNEAKLNLVYLPLN